MKNVLLLFSLIAIGAVLIPLWDSPPEFFFRNKKTLIEELPQADSYMRETVTAKFNEKGIEAYTLKADTGLYYQREDRFELDSPQLVSHSGREDLNPWQLKAREAHTTTAGQHVIFTGNVYAWQQAKAGKNEFFTGKLEFTPADNTARTDRKVILKYVDGETTGVGMRANFDTGTYKLLSQVKGIHYGQ